MENGKKISNMLTSSQQGTGGGSGRYDTFATRKVLWRSRRGKTGQRITAAQGVNPEGGCFFVNKCVVKLTLLYVF